MERHKRLIGGCCMVLVSAFTVAAAEGEGSGGRAAGANLIKNPSFEERSGPRKPYPAEPWGYGFLDTLARSPFAHWGYSGFFDGGEYDIKLGKGHTGRVAARLVCRRRGRGGICTEEIKVKPGTTLRFSVFVKAKGASGECFVNFEGDPGDGWAAIPLPRKPDYDWTEVKGTVRVPKPRGKRHQPDEEGNIRILVFIYTKAYGELWIDDVSLVPIAGGEAKEDAGEKKGRKIGTPKA